MWSTYVLRDRAMGASTITMQLARMRYGLTTRTISGKVIQIARAIQFERHYTKDEILEAYLNLAPYGGNVEGIGTASLIYFDKPASQLALSEALALAVIAQNPVMRDPSTSEGYKEMDAARSRLLRMWSDKYGLDDDARALFGLPLQVRSTSELPFKAPHFTREVLADTHGKPRVFTRTTLDLDKQSLIDRQIRRYTDRNRAIGIRNASAMLIDYRSMESPGIRWFCELLRCRPARTSQRYNGQTIAGLNAQTVCIRTRNRPGHHPPEDPSERCAGTIRCLHAGKL